MYIDFQLFQQNIQKQLDHDSFHKVNIMVSHCSHGIWSLTLHEISRENISATRCKYITWNIDRKNLHQSPAKCFQNFTKIWNFTSPIMLEKIWIFTPFKWLKLHLICPPWLEKIWIFTPLKWLKLHLICPPWLEKIWIFTPLNCI